MRILQLIEEPSGKLSHSRVVALLWGVGVFVVWAAGRELSWELLTFVAALLGIGAARRAFENKGPKPC